MELGRATLEEMQILIDWARQEGWNPGLNDAACFHAADPEGFFIGRIDGDPVGCISAVRYGSLFGFVGFYIVRPEWRGRGLGLKLWAAAMDHLQGRNLGLDGVLDQQENYRKSGFSLAYRNIRYEGKGTGRPHPGGLTPVGEVPVGRLRAYDDAMFGFGRHAFLAAWIAQPGASALAVVRDGELMGYGVLRPCSRGHKIGPLFAGSTEDAGRLLDALLGGVPADTPVFLDPPEINTDAVRLAEERGMKRVFETARMYKGLPPVIPLERLYGVTSFELG